MLNGGILSYIRQKVPNWFYSGAGVESVVRVLLGVFAEATHRGVNYLPLEELIVSNEGVSDYFVLQILCFRYFGSSCKLSDLFDNCIWGKVVFFSEFPQCTPVLGVEGFGENCIG